ncbi:hypothetical protein [Streptomyces sp. NPDC088757]|uniref:hypothetical protein n=1 Tax=Streptomyces sp. NPDC088757 TaxID=3365889 RepID=UPI00382DAA7B
MQHTLTVPPVDFQTNGHGAWPLLDGIPAQPMPLPVAGAPSERCAYCKQPATHQSIGATGATYWMCDGCNEATALGRTVHTAHFERATFGAGVKMVWKKVDATTLRVGFDPAEMTALEARFALGIYAKFTEGEKVDKLVELARDAETPAIREIFTVLLDQIDEYGDPDGTLRAAENVFTRVVSEGRGDTKPRCPLHTWCVETDEEHVEHTGDSIEPEFLDDDSRAILAAGLTHWGKGVRVGFLEQDFTPAEARTKLAELRAHLDAVEQLIATAEASE